MVAPDTSLQADQARAAARAKIPAAASHSDGQSGRQVSVTAQPGTWGQGEWGPMGYGEWHVLLKVVIKHIEKALNYIKF